MLAIFLFFCGLPLLLQNKKLYHDPKYMYTILLLFVQNIYVGQPLLDGIVKDGEFSEIR